MATAAAAAGRGTCGSGRGSPPRARGRRVAYCYAARRSQLRGKAGLASQGNYGPDREVDDSLGGPTAGAAESGADQPDRTTRAASPRPHPNGTRRVTSDMTGSDPGRRRSVGHRYVPEEPAAQCEGTCACNCNNLLSAVVTVYGHQRHFERCCRYDAAIQYKPRRCQRQQLDHVPILDSVP